MKLLALLRSFLRRLFGLEAAFLCDSCRYNYGNICTRPERPNAKVCPDYKRSKSVSR